jgi:glycosyltransferase involved in cell wall biosynthesis
MISVLMPTYNPDPKHLREALNCLFKQSVRDWELIICQEPTGEDLQEMIPEYLKDPRVKVYTNEKCLGIGPNWNRCLSYAQYDYIQYLFQDDIWYPEMLEHLKKDLDNNPTAGMAVSFRIYKYEGEIANIDMYEKIIKFQLNILKPGFNNGKELLLWWLQRGLHPNIIGEPPFLMMRKSAMTAAGPFHATMTQGLDNEYWSKMLAVADMVWTPKTLGEFRVHNAGASAINQRAGRGLADRLNILYNLSQFTDKDIAKAADTALKEHLPRMMAKYLDRKKTGGNVSAGSSKEIKEFCMSHPLLSSTSLLKATTNRKYYRELNDAFDNE